MKTLRSFSLLLLVASLSTPAWAASILQVRNKKAMVDLSGLIGVKVGDQLFAVDTASGKRRALLVVSQIKNDRAIVEIRKGRAEVGQELQARAGTSPISRPVSEDEIGTSQSPLSDRLRRMKQKAKNGPAWGLLLNMHQTSMNVKFTVGQGFARREATSDLSGSSFGLSGFYDYVISPRFQIRALGGFDQLSAAGSTAEPDCGNETTRDCSFDVTYLSLGGQARLFLNDGNVRFWLGGGGGFLLAMSKSSNILDTSQISTNQVYFVSGGTDIGLSRNSFIPLSLDYGMFPSSETVKANIMTFRVGYGWFF